MVYHGRTLHALHAAFPYDACALLIVQWSVLLHELAFAPSIQGGSTSTAARRITDCLAGWDGVLLLCDTADAPMLAASLGSRLAPRLGLSLVSDVDSVRWAQELVRVAAAAATLPSARGEIDETLLFGIARLPLTWQPTVHESLRNREAWTVKRLHAECQVGRRTLERGFRRAGLPSPGSLLRESAAAGCTPFRGDEKR